MIHFFLTPLCFWGIFFLIITISIFSKYIFMSKVKQFFYLYRWFFSYFFIFFLFILVFWIFIYNIRGVNLANKNIICFLTSYLLEITLSIDNIFAWFIVFKSLNIPVIYQKKVLLYGLLGALILRFIFSFFGSFLFSHWHWMLYFFGILFILISFKMLFMSTKKDKNKKNIHLSWIYKILRVTNHTDCKDFFVKINGKIFCTPLFIALIFIELSDIIFSADSIPAIFSVTNNLFIILSSNIFSVLGLRFMYLFIAPIINKFPILEYALSLILMFIGIKILFEKFITISTTLTFIIVLIILVIAFIINIIFFNKKK
ncbi:Putative membrane-bound redox modulator Alx [Buchnera aphidicola (Protaphis terricola)]|uniref:TerC family protein n=1 Tax=Buchnera aphidicola TaxID=9 RepID=UPI0034643C47